MRKKKKYPVLEQVRIEKAVAGGKCLAHIGETVLFVEGNVAPEDVIDVQVIRKKKSYWVGQPVQYKHFSPLRQKPFCEHFGVCGGCKWQHLQYEAQLSMKQNEVQDALARIAKVDFPNIQPIIGADKTTYYRNKLEFTFSNNRWLTQAEIDSDATFEREALGFHIPGRFDKIVDITHCHLQSAPSNEIRLAVKAFALKENLSFFDLRQQENLLRNLVVRTTSTGELMVIVIFFEPDMQAVEKLMAFLQTSFFEITSLYYIVNPKKNDAYQDLTPVLYAGKPYITESMEDLQFRISPKAFYQTNSEQAYELYKIVRTYATLQGKELVYDLYTGTGSIANFIARKAKQVIGIEYIEAAIKDAQQNAAINGIDNTLFFAGDMKDVLNTSFLDKHGKPDVIITDPPRAGMHEAVINTILVADPAKIVYVSCNPATQARDLQLLDHRYQIVAVQPVDMFPHTHHVENVVQLIRR
ncbi:MAG: 23S rRNA (uracil(1939)-C(5))-methyltransferase RlmD [Thermonemataceae bacterium]